MILFISLSNVSNKLLFHAVLCKTPSRQKLKLFSHRLSCQCTTVLSRLPTTNFHWRMMESPDHRTQGQCGSSDIHQDCKPPSSSPRASFPETLWSLHGELQKLLRYSHGKSGAPKACNCLIGRPHSLNYSCHPPFPYLAARADGNTNQARPMVACAHVYVHVPDARARCLLIIETENRRL